MRRKRFHTKETEVLLRNVKIGRELKEVVGVKKILQNQASSPHIDSIQKLKTDTCAWNPGNDMAQSQQRAAMGRQDSWLDVFPLHLDTGSPGARERLIHLF